MEFLSLLQNHLIANMLLYSHHKLMTLMNIPHLKTPFFR